MGRGAINPSPFGDFVELKESEIQGKASGPENKQPGVLAQGSPDVPEKIKTRRGAARTSKLSGTGSGYAIRQTWV